MGTINRKGLLSRGLPWLVYFILRMRKVFYKVYFICGQVELVEEGEIPGVAANSTMIGVTSVRKHKNYELYYQTWTR